jgi:hypothetical protein
MMMIKIYMFRASSLPIIRSSLTVHSALVSFLQVFDDRFQTESGSNCSSILTQLAGAEFTVENS